MNAPFERHGTPVHDTARTPAPPSPPRAEAPAVACDAAPPDAHDAAADLRRLRCYDPVTGLPNRLLFREQLDLQRRQAQRHGGALAVLMADIDDFRRIKHTLGRRRSDLFLRTIAQRLASCVRASDLVAGASAHERRAGLARVEGNEFAIVLTHVTEPADAERVARRMREAAGAVFAIDGIEVFPTLSVGVALYPGDGAGTDELLEHADIALGRAKDLGKDRVQFYNASMNALAADRLELESMLRRALDLGELFPVFQPRYDVRTGLPCGSEALLRWRHPKLGELAPGRFIDIAEQSRLIVPIGAWMLEAASRQNRAWQAAGLVPLPVGVNVSALQICRPDFVATVARALERSGLDPRWLEIEVTESMLMQDTAGALRALQAVKGLGARIAIDDFGTGFSSLTYLRDFPFDVVKIDRSFVQRLPEDERTAAITCGVIELARRLRLDVVAEGVETDAQRRFLQLNGCPLMQGYLFCRPLPAGDLERVRRGDAAPSTGAPVP